jgi:hypothetical protein
MKKHICILFCYHNYEHIIKCYESLYSTSIDFFVLENKSIHSDKIEDYFKGKDLKGYIQFNKNISNNAPPIFFNDYKKLVEEYDYITFTDCDIEVKSSEETFTEIIKNLNLPNVVVSCVDLSMDNLPTNISGAEGWIPPSTLETDEYIVCPTGGHLMTIKRADLSLYTNTKSFKDETILQKVKDASMLWVKTKVVKAKHLTWDLYKDEDEYYRFKVDNPGIWSHGEYCDYKKII